MWLNLAVALLVLSIGVIGTFVMLRGNRSRVNTAFGFFCFAVAGWIAFNYVGANFKTHDISLIATRLDFLLGCGLVFVMWYFSAALLAEADTKRKHAKLYGGPSLVLALLLVTASAALTLVPTVIDVTKSPGQELEVIYGDYYFVFAIGLVLVLAAVVVNFVFTVKSAKGRLKRQVGVMLAALGLSVLIVGFANLVLPQLSDSAVINLIAGNFAYVGFALFVVATFYSIVRHRLFDLRLVLARSVAYLLLITVLVVLYIVLTVIVSTALVKDVEFSWQQAAPAIISIVVLALTINPFLSFFRKITNRLFYKDIYEPQQLLGDLNNVLITRVELQKLLHGASEILERYLKVYFTIFELNGSNMWATSRHDPGDIRRLKRILERQKEKIILVDELGAGQEKLRDDMNDLNIAIASKLSTTQGGYQGYLFLGSKKNGEPFSTQDVEMIGIASGELVIAIENALRFEEIQSFNRTLQEKIEGATRELRHKNERLRVLDQTKDDFISMASHQLRTPLTSVKGYVSMVLDGDAGKVNELQKKLLNQSFLSSQRMVYLISDLLNVSRLRTGKFVIEPVESNLAEVLESEVEQLQETAKGRELKLTYHKPDAFPVLMIDENKLRQVIMNFIDNAIYYTPAKGHIAVNLVDRPDAIEFTVVDDGIGVPKAEQHHLFSKFYRAHNAKRARPDGTGLGLFMAKKVIIAQGGAVIFKSQEGKGSTFGFTFPKRKLLPKTTPADKTPEKPEK